MFFHIPGTHLDIRLEEVFAVTDVITTSTHAGFYVHKRHSPDPLSFEIARERHPKPTRASELLFTENVDKWEARIEALKTSRSALLQALQALDTYRASSRQIQGQ